MTGPRRHRRVGAAVGAAVVLLLLVALFGLGGRGVGDPSGRPEALHGATPHPTSVDRSGATLADDDGPRLPDLGGMLPSAPVLLTAVLAVVGLVLARPFPPLVARPVPVRVGRGPPPRRR